MTGLDRQPLESGLCGSCSPCNAFRNAAAIGLAYVIATTEGVTTYVLTVTDSSTYTSPDARAAVLVRVYDSSGKYVSKRFTGSSTTMDLATLNRAAPLTIKIQVISTAGCEADVAGYNIMADKDFTQTIRA